MLAAGQIVFGATAATAAPALTLAGKPATLVFGFDRKLTYANVIVRREDFDSGKIKSLKDLAGKRVGATQPQSSTWLMALYLMQKAGVADKVDIRPWATWPPCWARSRPARWPPAWPPCR